MIEQNIVNIQRHMGRGVARIYILNLEWLKPMHAVTTKKLKDLFVFITNAKNCLYIIIIYIVFKLYRSQTSNIYNM